MNKKWKRILTIIYILILMLMLSTATYAYFTMIQVSSVSPHVKTEAATTDWLVFSVGDPINLTASEENFSEGMGDVIGKTYGGALLQVNNPNKEVSYFYDVILDISQNEFVYSTMEQKTELLLKVTDPNGDEVTEIDGLEYKEVTNGKGEVLKGFDITTQTGKFYLASSYEITSNLQTQHIWNVEVVLVNLDSDQDLNAGKNFEALLKVQKTS